MKYQVTKLVADAAGESHFEDVEAELSPVEFIPNTSPLHVSTAIKANEVSFFGASSGWTSDWHVSQNRNLFVLISGEWEIEVSDGETRVIRPGETILVEDTTGRGHRSRVSSDVDAIAVLIQLHADAKFTA